MTFEGPLSRRGLVPGPGLCGGCLHVREVVSGKGSVFLMCGRWKDDPAFPKYPPLPVVRCDGFELREPVEPPGGQGAAAGWEMDP